MPLFGRKKPVKPLRPRKKRTWLDQQAREASPLIQKLKDDNPVIQAAIASRVTGVTLEPKDIKIPTSAEKFEAVITAHALEVASKDEKYMAESAEVMLDNFRYKGAGGYHRRKDNGDGLEYELPGGYGPDYHDPLTVIETFQQIKELMKGEMGGFGGIGPVLTEVIRILPAMMGKQEAPVRVAPQTIMVEVEGQLVPMTREGYEIYKKQREQLRLNAPPSPPPAAPPVSAASTAPPAPPAAPTEAPAAAPAVEEIAQDIEEETPAPFILPPEVIDTLVELAKRLESAMGHPPGVFVNKLFNDKQTGDTDSIVIFNALVRLENFDDAVARLKPFKQYPEFAPFIVKLEANRTWCEEALAKLKEMAEDDG